MRLMKQKKKNGSAKHLEEDQMSQDQRILDYRMKKHLEKK